MTEALDFQSIILSLQRFWAERGCLIWQPYYLQVGAGTNNPGTFLRVLGPEPWNVVYVEPSIRPDDARYGENPNRMQKHYQLQVILKPDPGNPQELYLKSLASIGIDPRRHDFRFVEDNWESPTLGAWGLGWEVWLDGQEITQFTYFQQAGGQMLDPVSVEITYGLDRIAIALQRVNGFTEIRWNSAGEASLTAGDVNLQEEQEQSKYYFEVADIERQRQLYDLFEREAIACLDANLVLPAHDYILKCSHTFNVLDARGAIGVTERQHYFGRMRDLSRRVADAYLGQRQRLEYPFLKGDGETRKQGDTGIGNRSYASAAPGKSSEHASPAPLLVEIGTEELPHGDLASALEQLRNRLPVLLEELRLEHGEVQVLGTPRRLALNVKDLSPRSADLESLVKGPPASRAFDSLGQPTKAAEGFARSKGVAVSDLQVREMDGGNYVVALTREAGRPAVVALAEALPDLIASLRFDKTMRWNSSNVAFSRPIRWLVALYGGEVVPFLVAGVASGRVTRGLRYNDPEEFVLKTPAEYFAALEKQGILLDPAVRRETILSQVTCLADEVQGGTRADAGLLAEVGNLVEAPAGLRGSFDPSHLHLPQEVLISVMKKHQRYFPVEQAGKLMPYFIAIANRGTGQDAGMELIVEGNEHVIRARFADAAFFVRDDLKRPLEAYVPRLATLAFQAKLGSMFDKVQRVVGLVEDLSGQIGLDEKDVSIAHRAAQLCKADLATKMVVEMTSLQGIMGRYYALRSGESEPVAQAIFEHYLPRFSGDILPQARPGLLVGFADRLDTLAGLFAVGLAPSGARDPFALRRAALGLVQALLAHDLDFDLRGGLQSAAARLPVQPGPEVEGRVSACLEFIVERLRNLLIEGGARYDIVDAVLSSQGYNPARAACAVKDLAAWVARPDWHTILPAYARCVRITRDHNTRFSVEQDALVEQAESDLYAALLRAESEQRAPGSVNDFLNAFLPMIPVINRFFDDVLVMAEDPRLRQNRLGLLQRIAALAERVADLSKLEGF
jgi:glycyl-tRNA synthetase